MFKTVLAIGYFSYLLMAGSSMAGGLSQADKTSTASQYQANLCALYANGSPCN